LALAVIAGAIGYSLIGSNKTDTAQADGAATTKNVSAVTGAQVMPTEPPLKVEPK
jgi:hypothetical protein